MRIHLASWAQGPSIGTVYPKLLLSTRTVYLGVLARHRNRLPRRADSIITNCRHIYGAIVQMPEESPVTQRIADLTDADARSTNNLPNEPADTLSKLPVSHTQ